MILYATKQTFERFKLKLPNEMSSPFVREIAQSVLDCEQGDKLLEWGAKLFYFDRRKCIQVSNFASKLTFFLVDIKLDDLPEVGNLIAHYLMELYANEKETLRLLECLFADHPAVAFSRLTDKSIIATLNQTQSRYLEDGYRLYDYIENNILMSRKINKDVNRRWLFTEQVDGKSEYYCTAEKFACLLKERYPE